jgi:hypothetical protein
LSRSLHHIRLIMTWPLRRNILETSRSFGNFLCDPVSITGCQTMIRWHGSERGGGVAFRVFFAGDSTKARRLVFWFCSSPHQGGRLTGDWDSAAPDLLTVPGQASRYAVRLKCWFGCLYLKFSFGYLAIYSVPAPQVVFMGVSGSQDIYFYGGAVICVISISTSQY